jgi:hypothetical protein
MFEKKQSYTPTEAQQAYGKLDQLIAQRPSTHDRPVPIGDTSPAEFRSR